MSLIYCYGVIGEPLEPALKGFESGDIYIIKSDKINAVVSDVSEDKFSQESIDKNVTNMAWLAENAPMHEKVVDSVMEKATILPMKFCTIFKSEAHVKEMLKEKQAHLEYNLKALKDKVEMSVKVYFDSEKLEKRAREESPEIKERQEKAKDMKPGTAYFEKQKIEILLKEKARSMVKGDAKGIIDKLTPLAERSKEKALLDKKVTGRDMLLNVVFLIDKKEVDNFKKAVNSLDYPLEIEVWGPFPAYNFMQ